MLCLVGSILHNQALDVSKLRSTHDGEGAASYSKSDVNEDYRFHPNLSSTHLSWRSHVVDHLTKKLERLCTWEPHTSKEEGINFIKNKASLNGSEQCGFTMVHSDVY